MTERCSELGEAMYWLGREIQEARRALWDGRSGKAFASIQAAEEKFEEVEELLDETEVPSDD